MTGLLDFESFRVGRRCDVPFLSSRLTHMGYTLSMASLSSCALIFPIDQICNGVPK